MSGSDFFDPYRKWFGIRDPERPPNHYRLLGIEPFEDDPDVVQNGADQRMAYLRQFQTGQHSELSQRLLNEVTKAKICLLNGKKKSKYDQTLKAAEASRAAASAPPDDDFTLASPAAADQNKPIGTSSSVSVSAEEVDKLLAFGQAPQTPATPSLASPTPVSPVPSAHPLPGLDAPAHRETIDASSEETLDLGSRDATTAVVAPPAANAFQTPTRPGAGSSMATAGKPSGLGGLPAHDPLAGLGGGLPVPPNGAALPSILSRRQAPQNPVVEFFKSTAGVATLAVGIPVLLLLFVVVLTSGGSKPKPNAVADQDVPQTQATAATTSEGTGASPLTDSTGVGSSGAATPVSPAGSGAMVPGAEVMPPAGLAAVERYPETRVTGADSAPVGPEAGGVFEHPAGGLATGFINGGAQAVVVTWDGWISIYDFASSSEVGSRFGPARRLAAAAVSPLGDVALLAGEDGALELWSLVSRAPAMQFDLHAERPELAQVTRIAFSPDGRAAATVGLDKTLRIWMIGRATAAATLPTGDGIPRSVALSAEGRLAAVGSADGRVQVCNPQTGAGVAEFQAHSGVVRALAFSPTGDLLVSGGDDGSIQIWRANVSESAMSVLYRGGDSVHTLAVSPDGRWLLAAGGAGYLNGEWQTTANPPAVQLWDLVNRSQIKTLPGHRATVEAVAFSSKAPQALSTGFDGAMRLWNLPGISYGASALPGAMAASGSPPANPGLVPNPGALSAGAATPLNAGLSPADLTPHYALDPVGWLATTQAVFSNGPAADAAEPPEAPPGFEKYWRTRELPAPAPLLTEEAWQSYNKRFGPRAAELAKSGTTDDTRLFARELLGEAQLVAGREPGTQAFLIVRAFALAVGRKGDVELANEAVLQFRNAAVAAPPELRLPLDIVQMELIRELLRLLKRSEKTSPMDLPPVHDAMVKSGLQLSDTYRLYSYYDEAKRVLNDAAFTESLRSLPEGDPNALRERTNEYRRDVARWAELKTQVQKVLSENKLDDPAGRMQVGKAFVGQLANLELAAPLLADGNDPALATVAKRYAESQASPDAYLELAKALHQAAAPGLPEGAQAALLTMGAEAAKRYLNHLNLTQPTGKARDEAERLARVLTDRSRDMRPKFFPTEALYREGEPMDASSSRGDTLSWGGAGSPMGSGSPPYSPDGSGYGPGPGPGYGPGGPGFGPGGPGFGPGPGGSPGYGPGPGPGSGGGRPMLPRSVRGSR